MMPEAALVETVRFTAVHAGRYPDDETSAPWLVTGSVLMAQQAAAIALRAAGDSIPAQVGATEILLRAASKDRLPAPFTLPFGTAARQGFDRLVEARNTFAHPRGIVWFVGADTLARGIPVALRSVRHLILTQPVLNDLVSPDQQDMLRTHLKVIESVLTFIDETF